MLPQPDELERICKGLAVLDAIASPEWEYRYFSFNAQWAEGERMASMRNGSGDDRFLWFGPAGAFFKAFWHEYAHEEPSKIFAEVPSALAPQLAEPAFDCSRVTFGGWHDGRAWTLRGNEQAVAGDLAILSGDPEHYRAYAADYFELDIPLAAIEHVLAGKTLSDALVKRIANERTLADLGDDLAEIRYDG